MANFFATVAAQNCPGGSQVALFVCAQIGVVALADVEERRFFWICARVCWRKKSVAECEEAPF